MKDASFISMASGVIILASILVSSFLYMVLGPIENILLWSLCASSFLIGITMNFAIFFDFRAILNGSSPILDNMSKFLIISYPVVMYPTLLIATSFSNEIPSVNDWMWFAIHATINFTGFALYLMGRSFAMKQVSIEMQKRRRGKRSPVSRREIRQMAESEDFEGLCRILQSDVNFRNRELAAEILGDIDNSTGCNCLLVGLRDEESSVRLAAAISLLKFNNYEGRSILETVLESGHKDDRMKVIKALRNVDQEWAVSRVEEAKCDQEMQEVFD